MFKKSAESEESEALELSVTGVDERRIRVELAVEVEDANLGVMQRAFLANAQCDEELRPWQLPQRGEAVSRVVMWKC